MHGSFDLDHGMDAAASKRAETTGAVPPSGATPVASEAPADREPPDSGEPALSDSSLDAARIEEIRERYSRGVYDSPDVLDAVARRLLARGDV